MYQRVFLEVSIVMGVPQHWWVLWKILFFNGMIWGHPYFRTPPCVYIYIDRYICIYIYYIYIHQRYFLKVYFQFETWHNLFVSLKNSKLAMDYLSQHAIYRGLYVEISQCHVTRGSSSKQLSTKLRDLATPDLIQVSANARSWIRHYSLSSKDLCIS
jgi:hypothetical protein